MRTHNSKRSFERGVRQRSWGTSCSRGWRNIRFRRRLVGLLLLLLFIFVGRAFEGVIHSQYVEQAGDHRINDTQFKSSPQFTMGPIEVARLAPRVIRPRPVLQRGLE